MEFHTYNLTGFANVKGLKSPRNIVGPIVRELRTNQGLTQPQLVARLQVKGWDVSRDIIARIEGQIRWVADFEIAKLAAGLGIEAPDLLRRALAKAQKQR